MKTPIQVTNREKLLTFSKDLDQSTHDKHYHLFLFKEINPYLTPSVIKFHNNAKYSGEDFYIRAYKCPFCGNIKNKNNDYFFLINEMYICSEKLVKYYEGNVYNRNRHYCPSCYNSTNFIKSNNPFDMINTVVLYALDVKSYFLKMMELKKIKFNVK